MAACVRRINNVLLLLRALRCQQQPNERFLSTSLPLFAPGSDDTGRPPQFTPPAKPVIIDKTQTAASLRRFLSPEFIPLRQRINPLKAAIERKDMIRRRKVLNIPEFYVGSILAVTMTDQYASGKSNRFVGICIQRGGRGLGATFILRNIIENQGVEICYEMYSPLIQKMEVLRLEKRLDDNLMYLRDALPEYSTVDPDMKPLSFSPTGDVPINTIKVRMRPKPWSKRWERPKFNIKGIRFDLCLTSEQMEHAQKWAEPWREYDMLKEYDTSRLEERILKEIKQEMRK